MENSTSSNTKRIAKNTILLYVRMLFSMAVSLYTSRVVLNVLGVSDYGLYNVVGGVVLMFSFLNGAMSLGIQRSISYEIGKQSMNLNKLFVASINVQYLIAIIVLVLSETIGLWFLNTKIVMPESRIEAANWVFQSAVLSFVLMIVSVPYTAFLISKEKMGVYAYISIFDTLLKLIIVLSISYISGDKLKIYAVLLAIVAITVLLSYYIYCRINYWECRYSWDWDSGFFRRLLSYSGWNLFGGISAVCNNYGINIVLNLFFGPTVNAARGIAYQVNSAVVNFTSNFQTAMNPQIVKSYASKDYNYMRSLIYNGAKYSFFLLLFITLPILIETSYILKIWLKIVPEYAVAFTRLVIVTSLVDCLSGSIMMGSQASGNIKVYQSVVGSLTLSNLPIAYCLLYIYHNPIIAFVSTLGISIIALFVRLVIVSRLIPISISDYFKRVISPVMVVAFFSIVPSLILWQVWNIDTFYDNIGYCLLIWFWSILIYWVIGIGAKDKKRIKEYIKKKKKCYQFLNKV